MSDWREKLAGRRVVASVSGGKDSAAMSLWLTEQGIEHDRVFMNTYWEHPSLYPYIMRAEEAVESVALVRPWWTRSQAAEYVERCIAQHGEAPLPKKIGTITVVRGPETMEQLVLRKGIFPTGSRRFCTSELKKKPLRDYIANLQDGWMTTGFDDAGPIRVRVPATEVLNTVGIRAEESEARAENPEWEWADFFDCEVWRPILNWKLDDVVEIHRRHGLRPHHFYTKGLGVRRLGCWPCIYATKAEIRFIADEDPERIDYLRELEAKVSSRAGEKKLKIVNQTWFRAEELARGFPIDEAVQWSRTSHGGRQYEMFAAAGRERGCMRWGLCETAPTPPENKEDPRG